MLYTCPHACAFRKDPGHGEMERKEVAGALTTLAAAPGWLALARGGRASFADLARLLSPRQPPSLHHVVPDRRSFSPGRYVLARTHPSPDGPSTPLRPAQPLTSCPPWSLRFSLSPLLPAKTSSACCSGRPLCLGRCQVSRPRAGTPGDARSRHADPCLRPVLFAGLTPRVRLPPSPVPSRGAAAAAPSPARSCSPCSHQPRASPLTLVLVRSVSSAEPSPEDKAASILAAVPDNSILTKTGTVLAGTGVAAALISNEIYVRSASSLVAPPGSRACPGARPAPRGRRCSLQGTCRPGWTGSGEAVCEAGGRDLLALAWMGH